MDCDLNPTVAQSIKIVTVGDALVGKSCAIANFQTSVAPLTRESTIFDSTTATIDIDGQPVVLSIWDTTGKKEYRDIRKSVYRDADVILIFFSVADPLTYASAISSWLPEVNEANSKSLKVFVGNKIDVREKSTSENVVREEMAIDQIQQGLRCRYLECSAFTGKGLHSVFEYCVRERLQKKSLTRQIRKMDSQACCQIM